MKRSFVFWIPALFSIFVFVSWGALTLWGDRLPVFVTNGLSLSLFVFLPLNPLFKSLGLTTGEFWQVPSIAGLLLGVFIYDALLILLLRGLSRLSSK